MRFPPVVSRPLGALGVLALHAVMISRLLLQRARRRRAEASLRESEARFRSMADTAAVMLWIADVDGLTTFCNRASFDFAGASLDEPPGMRWVAGIHPDDRHRCLTIFRQSVERREGFTFEARFRRHDGDYRWLLCTGVPRYADRGTFEGYVGSSVDITLRHEAELEHRLHMMEVAHLNRLATTGALTAAIAHELSQPLTAILYNTTAAIHMLDGVSSPIEKLRPILAEIRHDDQRATDIIRRLRDLLQKHELARQPLAVNPVVRETLQLLSAEAAARRVALTFKPSDADPRVAGDRVHLQQVVLNLVLNAMEAVGSMPIEERRVAVRTELGEGGTVEIAVCDSGPGVSPDALGRVFEPFHTTKENGLGLGLSISRTIVAAHEGRIWAECGGRGGATFHVALPLLEPEDRPFAADAPPARTGMRHASTSTSG